jgi:hypothetical protein
MSQDSSPRSAKSDPVEAVKEDAETTATRKELKNTTISGVVEGQRAKTPDSDSADDKEMDLKDHVSSPKKKRARDQLDDEKVQETEGPEPKDGDTKVDPDLPSPKRRLKHNGQAVKATSPTKKRTRDQADDGNVVGNEATDAKDGETSVHSDPPSERQKHDGQAAGATSPPAPLNTELRDEQPKPVATSEHAHTKIHECGNNDPAMSAQSSESESEAPLTAPTREETQEDEAFKNDGADACRCCNHGNAAQRDTDEDEKDRGSRSEPEKKRHRDELSPASDAIPTTAEPARDSSEKKREEGESRDAAEPAATSSSTFAKSGFAKLSQATSPFGALGGVTTGGIFGGDSGKTSSVFGSGAAAVPPATQPPPALSFDKASGPSPFGTLAGSKPNGFGGGFGGGFASPFASAAPGRLSSFAKPGETFGSSNKTARPFGAPESDEGEDKSGDEDEEDSQPEDNEKMEKEDIDKEKEDAKADEKKKKLQMSTCFDHR